MTLRVRIFSCLLVLTLAVVIASPALGHQTTGRHNKTQNGKGCQVSHDHPGQCLNGKCMNGALCPTNAICERDMGFSSADRKYSWTNAWNCHGRTFDNRGSWTGSASIFISCDPSGVCPVSPAVGDAIVWNGGSKHSVTIVGSWNGLSTTVRSKYGCCGEYEHALRNSTNQYGSSWSVVRFGSSPVFKSLEGASLPLVREGESFNGDPDQLAQITQRMPWYETVIASAVEYAVEHPRRVREIGQIGPEARKLLHSTENLDARLAILAADLRDERHFSILAVYNHVADGLDFIEGIEAGQVLVKLSQDYPVELRPTVAGLLEDTVLSKQYSEAARGASLFFLAKILNTEERADLKQKLTQSMADKAALAQGQESVLEFFSRNFLDSIAE